MALTNTWSVVFAVATLAGCNAAQGYGGSKSEMLRGNYPQGSQGGRYGAQDQGENQFKFRIYTEPEYYGYESIFPGGHANYKSYRADTDANSFGTGIGQGEGVDVGRTAPNRYRSANRGQLY